MRRRAFGAIFLAVCLAVARPGRGPAEAGLGAFAQEGHPLTGTWAGDWGTSPASRTRVTIVMNWDGTDISGIINPGPDAVPLTRVAADWTSWTVRIEATAKDASGTAVPIAAEGRLEDIGSSRRKIVGTWMQGATRGDFTVTRE